MSLRFKTCETFSSFGKLLRASEKISLHNHPVLHDCLLSATKKKLDEIKVEQEFDYRLKLRSDSTLRLFRINKTVGIEKGFFYDTYFPSFRLSYYEIVPDPQPRDDEHIENEDKEWVASKIAKCFLL